MPWITAGGTVLGGILGGKGGGGGKQTSTTTQDTASYSQLTPNKAALPLYGWYAQNAQRLMGQPIPYFPGQGYVGPSGQTQQGVGQLAQGADAMLPFLEKMGQNYDFLSGAADVANNPYVQNMLGANAQQVGQQLREQWLPAVNRGAQAVNQMGSSRQGLAQGQAVERAAQALLNSNAQTMMNAYGQGLGAQQNALGTTPDVLRNLLAPGLGRIGAGQTVEGYQQKALDDQMARFNWMFTEPYQRMNAVQGWMQGLSPIGMQQGTSQMVGMAPNPNYTSPMQNAMAGMQMGGALGSALGGIFNNWGSSGAPVSSVPTTQVGGGFGGMAPIYGPANTAGSYTPNSMWTH